MSIHVPPTLLEIAKAPPAMVAVLSTPLGLGMTLGNLVGGWPNPSLL